MSIPLRAESGQLAVTVGFAAHESGRGVAYAARDDANATGTAMRVSFALKLRPALRGRDIAYAALNAVAEEFLRRGLLDVAFQVDDASIAADLAERRKLPAPLTVPYVALRCRLNRFRQASVTAGQSRLGRDLTNRARAEASLQIAA